MIYKLRTFRLRPLGQFKPLQPLNYAPIMFLGTSILPFNLYREKMTKQS